MYYNNTTTALALNDAGITYNFRNLTVKGNLTVSGTSTTVTTGLRVTGTMNVTSTGTTNQFGPTYVIGKTTVGGSSANRFGALWTDGTLTLNGTGATSATTLNVRSTAAPALSISSTVGTHTFGSTYIRGGLTTTSACTSPCQFGELWVDGAMTLGGTANFTATTLHVGGALALNSTTGTNTLGSAYVMGSLTTASTSTSPDVFGDLWVVGSVTLRGRAAVTSTSLHVGGAMTINNFVMTPAVVNSFGSTWVVGALSTASTTNSTSRFAALWVDANFTVNGQAAMTVTSTATHVGGDFTISGPTTTNTFGPVYCIGDVNWGGGATVKTTDYTNSAVQPAPMWVGGVFTRNGGPFNDEYGDTFVVFQVNFTPTSGISTVMCPLFATTEMITTSGNVSFGTMVIDAYHPNPRPMTLYMVCDNDGYYTQTANWGSTGQFYGLMILFEAGITLQNGCATGPAVVGSVLTIGGNNGLRLNNSAQIAYCQDVVDWVFFPTVSTSTVTQTVSGTWQELSPSGQ